jgi:hypothetical protein
MADRVVVKAPQIDDQWRPTLRVAAIDQSRVSGLTHRFYRYPARFSPKFAGVAIDLFSNPGDLVLDPYMGGATTIVEALVRKREVIGSDVNSLSMFLGRVKTTALTPQDRSALIAWANDIVPSLSYWFTPNDLSDYICERRTHNLNLPQARPIKKVIALALRTLDDKLPSTASREFARCALLNASQLFLNGRKSRATVEEFRTRVSAMAHEMLNGLSEFESRASGCTPTALLHCSAADLPSQEPFTTGSRASLVVTSPPYPGIHMLYHRWQVDGRRESPAPYWMANCNDGRGNSFYNFADRDVAAEDMYFAESLKTLKGIRSVMKPDGVIVQMVAFRDPVRQLRKYLANMSSASFEEMRSSKWQKRLWRDVPSRRWHANHKGKLGGSREVVLVHKAI